MTAKTPETIFQVPLQIKESMFGYSTFATRRIEAGERICEFHGRFFTLEEAKAVSIPHNEHFLQIDNDLCIGPFEHSHETGADDFINHSCDPNAYVVIEGSRAFLNALKGIDIGEEVTFDYSTTMDENFWEMDCACSAQQCRGRIRDFKYLPEQVQRFYISLDIVPRFILEVLKGKDKTLQKSSQDDRAEST